MEGKQGLRGERRLPSAPDISGPGKTHSGGTVFSDGEGSVDWDVLGEQQTQDHLRGKGQKKHPYVYHFRDDGTGTKIYGGPQKRYAVTVELVLSLVDLYLIVDEGQLLGCLCKWTKRERRKGFRIEGFYFTERLSGQVEPEERNMGQNG